ncbi:LuxR C-terminal-related transcriptional regulator [Pseudonocardia acaciae]|uniref:LuxR C-terminal-related transcriptional regulator n=1 Tax=Pseudonocardia acaciae TaxID=551276 RepID=UPI00048BA5AC|nr:response regulator transcription factor [Pseudonocardia acaciae]
MSATYDDPSSITVVVVDDHPIWREGVARDLTARGFSVVATVADSSFTARIAAATQPKVVVMDLDLDELSAVEAVRTIANTMPETRVLVLSERAGHRDVLDAVKAGAAGYLVKSASATELMDAVQRTAAGDAVFTAGLADLVLGEYQRLAAEPEPQASVPRLSGRETQVLKLVATGLTARQIATKLTLSPRTVENHIQNTLRKLHLHNRVELVRYAITQGLTE